MADMFSPLALSTLRQCVVSFHLWCRLGWLVPVIFDHQEVRTYISWAAQSLLTCSCHFDPQAVRNFFSLVAQLKTWLTCSRHFDSQAVHNSISFVAPSRLTCSGHCRLSESAYLYLMSSIITADKSPPLSTQRVCIPIPWAALHHHVWHVLATFLTFRWCVCLFYERHNHGWHVPASFASQLVCVSILGAAPWWLTRSCHFRCVIRFHLRYHQRWLVPTTFDFQEVRN